MDIKDELNKIADSVAREGMVLRASGIRAGAIEIAKLRYELAQCVKEREEWNGRHQVATMEIEKLKRGGFVHPVTRQ